MRTALGDEAKTTRRGIFEKADFFEGSEQLTTGPAAQKGRRKMDTKEIFSKYADSWRLGSEGSKPARNDLSGIRRTRTALKTLLTHHFEEILQPEHTLALRAAANVLGELETSLAKIIKPLEAEQAKRNLANAREALRNIDEFIDARSDETCFQSEEQAEAELALLNEFFDGKDAQDWFAAVKKGDYVTDARADRGALHTPDSKLVKLNARHRLAIRVSQIAQTGRTEERRSFRGKDEVWVYAGLEDFRTWKSLRDNAAAFIDKARLSVSCETDREPE